MTRTPLKLTRRSALAAGAAIPAGMAMMNAGPATAQAAAEGANTRSIKLGDFEVTTLLAGTRTVDNPQGIFGLNVDAEEFNTVSDANFLPTDKAQFFFTPTLVRTGSELVLFDTGLSPDSITGALAGAGVAPGDVDVVVITHMHGDHIGGLSGEGGETFTNARYVTGRAEYDAWAQSDNEGFEAKVRPLAEKITFLEDGGSAASGVTAQAAFGHTPGHMVYHIESGNDRLLVMADLANHYVWSLAYPDWEVRFDMDKAAAAQSRRNVLGMLAADRIPMIGYHMPFPAMGFVAPRGDGFEYVPASYQFMMQG